MAEHPSETDLLRWLERDLEPDEQRETLRHVDGCEKCRRYLKGERNLGALLGALGAPEEKS